MLMLLGGLLWWHWLVLAMALLVLELTAPVDWFVWIAIAAGLNAVIVAVIPGLDWPVQCVLFGMLSLATLVLGRRFASRLGAGTSDAPLLNQRGAQYIGRSFTLTEPIVNGYGTVKVGDSRWRVTGPELPAGQTVRVIGLDGTTLRVEVAG